MYYYYSLSCRGIKPWWKKYITAIQIIQFVTSFLLMVFEVYAAYTIGVDKCMGYDALGVYIGTLMFNGLLLLQFVDFYKSSYTKTETETKAQ